MGVTLALGILWTLYGVAGLLGFQNINEKYKEPLNKSPRTSSRHKFSL